MDTSPDGEDLTNEIEGKTIVHWNYRGLARLPEAIRYCAQDLQEIYLKDNKLQNLPDWMIELVHLTHLYLNGNKLKRVPDQLAIMSRLTVLDLSKNGISDLPPCVGDLGTLECLTLDENFLKKLPSELRHLKNLKSLSICSNELAVLPEWLGRSEKLEQLRVDKNYLRELPNGLTTAANLLTYLPFNAFVSHPSIYFRSNSGLNYLSYPMFRQLLPNASGEDRLDLAKHDETIDYECSARETKSLRISMSSSLGAEKCVIELPRQLMKVHKADANEPVSLWELAIRKIHSCVRDEKKTHQETAILRVPYNVLVNGPTAVCVNDNCAEPIFTEAWLIAAISCSRDSFSRRVPVAALYCSKKVLGELQDLDCSSFTALSFVSSCALNFDFLSEEFELLKWQLVHQRQAVRYPTYS